MAAQSVEALGERERSHTECDSVVACPRAQLDPGAEQLCAVAQSLRGARIDARRVQRDGVGQVRAVDISLHLEPQLL